MNPDRQTVVVAAATDARRMRHAGRELLSLALIESRNATLRWHAAVAEARTAPGSAAAAQALALLGQVGWFQERWIVRNLQRALGLGCDAQLPRLASIDPRADAWYDPAHSGPGAALAAEARAERPSPEATREYLYATLETTLDLLSNASEDDAGLYFYRLALFHEDAQRERLAVHAQTHGLGGRDWRALQPAAATPAPREPIGVPGTHWLLGSSVEGFARDVERPAQPLSVDGFEIDAQPVSWAQFAEFVEDGGYDEPMWWSADGASWKAATARRSPRHVEQMRGGVLARSFGSLVRLAPQQPAVHLSWYEAQAWCRWAGRRLPTEAEWEVAAHHGSGFGWGEVWEWTARPFEPYPGFVADPSRPAGVDLFGGRRTVRGASRWTSARLRHAKARRGLPPDRDDVFIGFRSCAV